MQGCGHHASTITCYKAVKEIRSGRGQISASLNKASEEKTAKMGTKKRRQRHLSITNEQGFITLGSYLTGEINA